MKKTKIIFLLPIYGGGGGERVVSELSLNFPGTIETVIVAFGSKAYYPYQGRLISLDIPLSTNFFLKPVSFFRGLLKFKRIISRERPDYVISLGNLQNIINVLISPNPILRVDNYISEGNKEFSARFYLFLVRMLFNKAKKVVVVSQGIEKDLLEKFGLEKEKIQLIYNPVDVARIRGSASEPLPEEYSNIFKSPVVINIGSLISQKGQWHLIRAFAKAKEEINDLKLLILGEGDLEDYLKELRMGLNLEQNVYFLGWQKNPFKFLSKSRLFVLSSLWEGFGIAIVEALACGVPVISTDCKSGPREILAPETSIDFQTRLAEYGEYGVLVPPLDRKLYNFSEPLTDEERILSEAIVKMISETPKSYSSDLLLGRAKDFNTDKIMSSWKFLEEIGRN